jgi:hypothetical protein
MILGQNRQSSKIIFWRTKHLKLKPSLLDIFKSQATLSLRSSFTLRPLDISPFCVCTGSQSVSKRAFFGFKEKVWICGFFVVRWPSQISTIEFALFLACVPESSTLGLCCKVNVTMLWGRSQLQRQFLTRPKVLETPASNMPVADGFIPHLL